jgi:glycosyltransferase involved in cell wall biosynthesis
MSSPSVSVVVPCFNQGRYLRDALQSALAQTRPAAEIIVVDDGSADETTAVAESFPGVTSVRQSHRGLAHARNEGLARAKGDYLVFLDADDRLHPEALAIGVAELQARPECAFVFGRCERIDAAGRRLPTVPPPPIEGDAYEALLRCNMIWTPAIVMFGRAMSEPFLYFDTTVGPSADYDLYLRIARARPIHGHGRPVADYRLHDASMSRNPALMLRSTVTVLRRQRPYFDPARGHAAACEYGLRSFQHHYSESLARRIRAEWRTPARWPAVVRAIATLVRFNPGGVVRGTARALRRLLARAALPFVQRPGTRWRSI